MVIFDHAWRQMLRAGEDIDKSKDGNSEISFEKDKELVQVRTYTGMWWACSGGYVLLWFVWVLAALLRKLSASCQEIFGRVKPWDRKQWYFESDLCVCVCVSRINCRHLHGYNQHTGNLLQHTIHLLQHSGNLLPCLLLINRINHIPWTWRHLRNRKLKQDERTKMEQLLSGCRRSTQRMSVSLVRLKAAWSCWWA